MNDPIEPCRMSPPADVTPERVVNGEVEGTEYISGAYDPKFAERMCEAGEQMGLKVVVLSQWFWWDEKGGRHQSSSDKDLKTVFVSLPLEGPKDLGPFWKLVREGKKD